MIESAKGKIGRGARQDIPLEPPPGLTVNASKDANYIPKTRAESKKFESAFRKEKVITPNKE